MHVYCPTQKAVVLVGFLSPEKILVFPSQSVAYPGLHLENKALVPIYDQIMTHIEKHCLLNDLGKSFDLHPDFAEPLQCGEDLATLDLGSIKDLNEPLPRYLQTLPVLIRGMPKDRSRLPYLKAWQTLTGAPQQDIRAIEVKS